MGVTKPTKHKFQILVPYFLEQKHKAFANRPLLSIDENVTASDVNSIPGKRQTQLIWGTQTLTYKKTAILTANSHWK